MYQHNIGIIEKKKELGQSVVFLKSIIVPISTKTSHVIITYTIYKSKCKLNLKEKINLKRKKKSFSMSKSFTISKRTSQADKGKGKALAVQPHFQKPSVRISDLHEGISIETISLQDTLLAEAMYSCGEKSVILQKVIHTELMFQDEEFTDLPLHIKLLIDNLQAAFTLRQKPLFQKTLQALELHLVSTRAFIEALGCQLPGKEDGDSSSTKTELQSLNSYLMGTSFSKLHPKIQQKTRLAIRTLPLEIQQNILTHTTITSSYDRWMYLFKVLFSTAFIKLDIVTIICE